MDKDTIDVTRHVLMFTSKLLNRPCGWNLLGYFEAKFNFFNQEMGLRLLIGLVRIMK
ncbi:MAG: hypothetical protein ACLU4J_25325 [Butyricimonas paravirosa]